MILCRTLQICSTSRRGSLSRHAWEVLVKSNKSTATPSEIKPQNILNLHKRGILDDIFPTASVTLPQQLLSRQCFYCGFDPTADSLHIGNLLPLMLLLHCQRAGHDVIAVLGTATASIGDPSDQSKDRNQLSRDEMSKNVEGISATIERIFKIHEEENYWHRGLKKLPPLRILNNYRWYEHTNVIDFFANEGRKFRMGHMIDKRFVRERLKSPDGLLLPEFLYQIFQAYDWLHLLKNYNCRFQFGGSDQLGNIHAGQHLISRMTGKEVYGLIAPLVTTASGQKIGKSGGNTIWLDARKTSPFEFYQFFLRQSDANVEKFLKYFTLIELKNIGEIMAEHNKHPERRSAQNILARNVCKLVHGEAGLKSAERCTQVLYQRDLSQLECLSDDEIDSTFQGMKVHYAVLEPATTVYDIATKIKAIPPGSIGMENINNGGVMVNGLVMKSANQLLLSDLHVLKNDLSIITVGKKNHHIVRWKVPDRLYSDGIE